MKLRATSFVRVSAIVLSALAVVLAAFALVPGFDYYNDSGALVRTEPGTPAVMAIGLLGFAAVGVVLSRKPQPWLGFAWIAATAGGFVLYVSEHLFDNLFLRMEPTIAGNIAGYVGLLWLGATALFGVACLAIGIVQVVQQVRAGRATAVAIR